MTPSAAARPNAEPPANASRATLAWRRSWQSVRFANAPLHLFRGFLGVSMLASFVYAQFQIAGNSQYQRPDWRGVAKAILQRLFDVARTIGCAEAWVLTDGKHFTSVVPSQAGSSLLTQLESAGYLLGNESMKT